MDDSKKIPALIAFCKLFLGNVKVEILLISQHLLTVFRMHPLLASDLHPHFLVNERYLGGTYLDQVLLMSDL